MHTASIKQHNGHKQVRIGDGEWKTLQVTPIQTDSQRFSLKCNVNGVISTFSAVINADQIDIFNEVRKKLSTFYLLTLFSIAFYRMVKLNWRLSNQSI